MVQAARKQGFPAGREAVCPAPEAKASAFAMTDLRYAI